MSAPVRIMIVEPSEIIRSGVLSVLRRLAGLHLEVFETGETGQLKHELGWHRPDILIINP